MIPRWITLACLAYLVAPIALLVAGSFGDLWLNTLLPTGATFRWYADVAADPSFRRAFATSLFVAAMTCAACVGVGLPLAYAVFRARSARVRALARVLYQLPVALPALVLAFGFILGYGRAGFLTQLLGLAGFDTAVLGKALFTPVGLAFASSYYLIPRVVMGILPLQLYSLISETGSDFPAAAALALLITAVCSTLMTTGEWFGSRHERHL